MYMAIGAAASAAMDLLGSLAPAKAPPPKPITGVTQAPGSFGALLAALVPAQAASSSPPSTSAATRSDPLKDLFARIDNDGDSQISRSEFRTALGANGSAVAAADSVFARLDTGGDGSVSLDELAAAFNAGRRQQDGSTSLTYADGVRLTMSAPAGDPARLSASSHAASSYHLVDQAAERRAQDLSATARQSLSRRI